MNWANLVTYCRLVLIPVVVVVYYSDLPLANVWAAVCFTVASLSDFLDGYLARRLNLTSEFGAFLDPVADKLLVAIVLIMLVTVFPDLLAATAVIIGREILISALREWMAGKGQRDVVAVHFSGKLKTSVQMVAIVVLMLASPAFPEWLYSAGLVLLYVAAFLSLWSMAHYFRSAWPALFP